MVDEGKIDFLKENIKKATVNKSKVNKKHDDVYIFVSFDLVNSTKIKYQYPDWLELIKLLISASNSDWEGLNFWKYNGDELLFYAKVVSLNQIATLLYATYKKANSLNDELKRIVWNDGNSNYIEDLLGIKTSIWLAGISDSKNALNFKLDNIDSVDFAGVNIDEGFRLSKCVIQNKFIVDPKIVFLLCMLADELQDEKYKSYTNEQLDFIRTKKQRRTLEDIFALFLYKQSDKYSEVPPEIKALITTVANNFRFVKYEKCKGVWGERNYPIIWYSDNWEKTIASIKYDEEYLGKKVDDELINNNYKEISPSKFATSITLQYLRKIYSDVTFFKQAIDNVLIKSNFSSYSKAMLDIQIDSRTYLYYSIVCVKRDTGGVLSFLRSESRGHLPNTWDFEQQKNAQRISGEEVITQIEDKFNNNYGIKIRVVKDIKRKSLIPMDIHPIYRRGELHNGILCFAYIEDDRTEDGIINAIKSRLNGVVSGYGYNMYSDVRFVHVEELNEENSSCCIAGDNVFEITYNEALTDSNTWNDHQKDRNVKCTTNFVLTVKEAIEYSKTDDR